MVPVIHHLVRASKFEHVFGNGSPCRGHLASADLSIRSPWKTVTGREYLPPALHVHSGLAAG